MTLSRREFCLVTSSVTAALSFGVACRHISGSSLANDGRLVARPRTGIKTAATGRIMLGLDRDRDAILQLPGIARDSTVPLMIMLHGATQNANRMFKYLGSLPEDEGFAVLAPNSRDISWDAISNGFGPDVDFLNRSLEQTFAIVAVDPTRISIAGFSDGATYAIALGLINGDLFKRVVAFSAGFVIDVKPIGKPGFFISHGTRDHILPIDMCGRRVAANLKSRGYDVTFREFDGDHEVPADIAREAIKWVKAP